MLAINRKEKESFFIYPNMEMDPKMTVGELFRDGFIEVFLNEIKRNQVKLSITAPKQLNIVRAELIDK